MSNLIDSVRSYILTCPFLSDGRVNVDYIGTDMGYLLTLSLATRSCRDTRTVGRRTVQFAFTSQEEYDQDARINIENSGFFQSFEEWLEQQSFNGNLPETRRKEEPDIN